MSHPTAISAPCQCVAGRPRDNEEPFMARRDYGRAPDLESAPTRHHISTHGMGRVWNRRQGKKRVGVMASLHAIAYSSWLNIFLFLIPLAWVAHFVRHPHFPRSFDFMLLFLAIVPLERLLDYCSDQLAYYLGKRLGDFVTITLNNAVEATLAVILLLRCQLRLLQSTIIGVIILHLLLIPGTAFITGGARLPEQDLDSHLVQLNHTLLTIGVMGLLLPAAFFAALDRGAVSTNVAGSIVNDTTREIFLKLSRGIAIVLLVVYICSRIFLHNPPGKDTTLSQHPNAPSAPLHEEPDPAKGPEVNQYVCVAVVVISVVIMGATVQWLVESIESIKEDSNIQDEWFGLILLPNVSFAADGFVAIWAFVRFLITHLFKHEVPAITMAKARAIDLSIQFTLLWMPFIILLGWWTNKPISLLFDFFEVAALLGACFIVNYVTADAKTNWAEGCAMVAFYIMITLCIWFYPGQDEIKLLLACNESVGEAVAKAAAGLVSIE